MRWCQRRRRCPFPDLESGFTPQFDGGSTFSQSLSSIAPMAISKKTLTLLRSRERAVIQLTVQRRLSVIGRQITSVLRRCAIRAPVAAFGRSSILRD
jgi:hypothetical protein